MFKDAAERSDLGGDAMKRDARMRNFSRFIGRRVLVQYLMMGGRPRWFVAKIKGDDDGMIAFSKEEWSSDGVNGYDDEALEIDEVQDVVLCPKKRQKEVILGAML